MSYKLYSPQSLISAGSRVEFLLKFFNFQVQFVRIPRTQWKSAQYLKVHPWGKVPSLETPEGPIFESHAIMRYFARKAGKMYGSTPAQTASIDQWLEFIHSQVYPNMGRIFYAVFGYFPTTKEQYQGARKQLWEVLKIVDGYLKDNTFLGGKQVSISDVSLTTVLFYPFRLIFDEKNRKNLPNLTKWFEHMSTLKEFQAHFGKLWLCQKQFVPEFEVVVQKKQAPKQEKPKQVKKKQQPKKKEQTKQKEEPKKKEQPKKKAKQQQQEENPFQQKKKANPLDSLPKSPFNMDDFKRQICNTPDKLASLKKLWETFDLEGWSLWRLHYVKYQGEGTVGYLTCNLKNGYLRNIDHFRKYTFATLGVFGVEGNYEIDGVWLWRGTEIPEQWKEHQSYDYFTFKKLDPKNEADQKLAEQYFLNTQPGQLVEGKPVYESKWFK